MFKRLLFFLMFLNACHAFAEEGSDGLPVWHPSVIETAQTRAEHSGLLYTKLELTENGDARVTYRQTNVPKPIGGTILFVSGRWMLVKGLKLIKGREIDYLDIAGLNSQLVMSLLSKALPSGPPAVGVTQRVSFTERNEPIRVATTSASGVYPAPWSLKGEVERISESTAQYSLDFELERGEGSPMHLEGAVSKPEVRIELHDPMDLADWAIYKLGPYEEKTSRGTMLDYGAKGADVSAQTLGELRAIGSR